MAGTHPKAASHSPNSATLLSTDEMRRNLTQYLSFLRKLDIERKAMTDKLILKDIL